MKRIGANGDLGPGVVLDPDDVSEALTAAAEPADFYLKNPSWGNNRNTEHVVADNHRGALAEFGVRAFYGLPHDGHLRRGKADLGTRTDVKGIVKSHHRLICMDRLFKPSWRYLLAFCSNNGDGRITVRVQGWAEGTNLRWEFFPDGLDESTDAKRPMWGIYQRFLNVQAYQVEFLTKIDW